MCVKHNNGYHSDDINDSLWHKRDPFSGVVFPDYKPARFSVDVVKSGGVIAYNMVE